MGANLGRGLDRRQPRDPRAARSALSDAASIGVDRIHAAVKASWTLVLGTSSNAHTVPFGALGGDSLKALQLAFHLERLLDRDVPLDIISSESTGEALVAALIQHFEAPTPRSTSRPTLFLCPGLGGDELRLAALRRALNSVIPIRVLEYPGLEAPLKTIGDLPSIAAQVVKDIITAQPSGPVCLMGYSFGGLVALSAVATLRRRGRNIAFFGVLDANVTSAGRREARLLDAAWESDERLRPRTTAGHARLRDRLIEWVGAALFRRRAYRTLKAIVRLRARHDRSGDGAYLALILLQRLRLRALRQAALERVDTPVHLFRAETRREPTEPPSDLGWGTYAPSVSVARMAGDHWTQFDPDHLARNAARVGVALKAALRASAEPPVASLAPEEDG